MTKKVLIAEDQPDSRRLLEDILERFQPHGVNVLIAVDGDEAYETAKKEQPNLILLDIMMPRKSGLEVCKLLKDDPAYKDMYIIIVSAKFQIEDRRAAANAGADEYISKPYDISLIVERVQSVLGITL